MPVPNDITNNPRGEGLYQMLLNGKPVMVPFSNVSRARQGGAILSATAAPRYAKDLQATLPRPVPQTTAEKMFGVNPGRDAFSAIASHVKNLVAGPYHALTDAPTQQELTDERNHPLLFGSDPDAVTRGFNRMFVEPTFNAVRDARNLRRAGGKQASWTAASTYDKQGNNIPTAGSKLIDGIPIYGPWARSYADEVHQRGALPATLGLGVDTLAPTAMGKIFEAVRGLAPRVAEWSLDSGRGTGGTILQDTQGVTPEAVARSARDKVTRELKPQMYDIARDSSGKVDLQDVIHFIDEAKQEAQANGDATAVNHLSDLRSQFAGGRFEGAYRGMQRNWAQPAMGALHIMEGFENPAKYDPEVTNNQLLQNVASKAADIAGSKLDSALGSNFERLRQHASRLNSIADSADETARNPSKAKVILKKEITDAASGAASGLAERSSIDPIVASTVGNMAAGLLPDVPTIGMGAARTLNSPITSRVASAAGLGGIFTPSRFGNSTSGTGSMGSSGERIEPSPTSSHVEDEASKFKSSHESRPNGPDSYREQNPGEAVEPILSPGANQHGYQSPFSTRSSGAPTLSSVSPANTISRAAGLFQYNPNTNPFSQYLQSRLEANRPTSRFDPGGISLPQATSRDSVQRFQEPPLTLKSMAPAAFPDGGTPRLNLYGWPQSQ
jgi:hypothetical protein